MGSGIFDSVGSVYIRVTSRDRSRRRGTTTLLSEMFTPAVLFVVESGRGSLRPPHINIFMKFGRVDVKS